MSSDEQKPRPAVDLEAVLQSLADEQAEEENKAELERLSKLTQEELVAEMKADGFDPNTPVGEFLEELQRLANLSPDELIAESDAQGIDENQVRKMVERAIAQADGLEKLLADENVERMAKMTAEEVRGEIRRAGLDPRQVGQILQTALAERGDSRATPSTARRSWGSH